MGSDWGIIYINADWDPFIIKWYRASKGGEVINK